MKFEETVRKNLVISKRLYLKSAAIANDMGITYPDYVRMLIASDVKKSINITDSIQPSEEILNSSENPKAEKNKEKEGELRFDKDSYYNDLPWSNKSSLKKNGYSWESFKSTL